MLVLTRGMKQQIVIGNGVVTVTVLEVRGGRVRLGIDAPNSVTVRRKELESSPLQICDAEIAVVE